MEQVSGLYVFCTSIVVLFAQDLFLNIHIEVYSILIF
jgi:hypothetical protein